MEDHSLIPYRSVRHLAEKAGDKNQYLLRSFFPVETEEEGAVHFGNGAEKSQRCDPPLLGMAHRHRPHP